MFCYCFVLCVSFFSFFFIAVSHVTLWQPALGGCKTEIWNLKATGRNLIDETQPYAAGPQYLYLFIFIHKKIRAAMLKKPYYK